MDIKTFNARKTRKVAGKHNHWEVETKHGTRIRYVFRDASKGDGCAYCGGSFFVQLGDFLSDRSKNYYCNETCSKLGRKGKAQNHKRRDFSTSLEMAASPKPSKDGILQRIDKLEEISKTNSKLVDRIRRLENVLGIPKV